jgi:hypothetical protein
MLEGILKTTLIAGKPDRIMPKAISSQANINIRRFNDQIERSYRTVSWKWVGPRPGYDMVSSP